MNIIKYLVRIPFYIAQCIYTYVSIITLAPFIFVLCIYEWAFDEDTNEKL